MILPQRYYFGFNLFCFSKDPVDEDALSTFIKQVNERESQISICNDSPMKQDFIPECGNSGRNNKTVAEIADKPECIMNEKVDDEILPNLQSLQDPVVASEMALHQGELGPSASGSCLEDGPGSSHNLSYQPKHQANAQVIISQI